MTYNVRDSQNRITTEVVDSFRNTPSDRLRNVMSSLVKHLHDFVREVELTESEWTAAINFLKEVGEITSDRRHEFILLSDVLGLSMTVVDINSSGNSKATESTVFGPFFVNDSPAIKSGEVLPGNAPGVPCLVSGNVCDINGAPIGGALIETWEADENGRYDVEYLSDTTAGRGHLYSAKDGSYSFWCVKPSYYSIPTDGPVGALLRLCDRSPMRPAHVHFKVSADGFRPLVTHIFEKGDPYLGSDAVFGVKESLIVDFVRHEGTPAILPNQNYNYWYEATFNPVLQGK